MDALWVLYDTDTITAVLNFLRTFGFQQKEPKIQHQGASGIQVRKNKGFLVVIKDEAGNKKSKVAKTIDDAFAIVEHGDPADEEHGDPADEEHGDGDQPDESGLNEHCKPKGLDENECAMLDGEHNNEEES